MRRQLTAIIEREGDGYVSFCPELDIASQGETIEDARNNLREALELFFETASQGEVQTRLHEEVYVTRVGGGRWVNCVFSPGDKFALSSRVTVLEVHQRGSHIVMQKRLPETTITVPVPNHDELRIGTLQSIIRQSGIPRNESET